MYLFEKQYLSIRSKLILFIVIPLILFFVVGMFFTITKISRSSEQQLSENVTTQAKNYAAILDAEFNTIANLASINAEIIKNNPNLDKQSLLSILQSSLNSKAQIYGVGIIFNGTKSRSSDDVSSVYLHKSVVGDGRASVELADAHHNIIEKNWFKVALNSDKPVWSEPYIDQSIGDDIKATVAVSFSAGDLSGASVIDLDLGQLQKHSGLESLTDNAFIITSKAGRFITHPIPEFIMQRTLQERAQELDAPGLKTLANEMLAGNSGQVRVEKLSAEIDEPLWIFFAPVTSTGWGFATALPEEQVLAFTRSQIQRGIIGISIILLLAIACVFIVSRNLTRPLEALTQAVEKLAQGELSTQVTHIGAQDEIGQLSKAFNNMTLELKKHIRELEKQYAARDAVESELAIARGIQSTLIPNKFPAFPDYKQFDLHAINHPASHVAGDFFDFFLLDSCRLFIVIADVSGKGVGPALLMAVSRTHIRNLAGKGYGPAQILTELNQLLLQDREQPMFVTVFVAEYNIGNGQLRYANGGHVIPFLIDAEAKVTQFGEPTGTIVGMLDEAEYSEEMITMDSNETIILYTDGILEARLLDGEFFGEEHFKTLLAANAEMSLEELCDSALAAVKSYQANKLSDDVTVLALRKLN